MDRESDGGPRFVAVTDRRQAEARLDDDEAGAGLVIPGGFQGSLAGSEPQSVVALRRADAPIAGAVAAGIAAGFAARADAGRIAALVAAGGGGAEVSQVIDEVVASEPAVQVVEDRRGRLGVDLISYFGPSMGVLFLFFTVGATARSLLGERATGTLSRLQAAPVTAASVLGGKVLAVFVLGMGSLGVLWAATTVAFDADWGHPLPVVALSAATVAAVAGVAALVASAMRSEQAADGAALVVSFAFALLGGNFLPPGDRPAAFETASKLVPNGWALDGFTATAFDGAGIGDVALNLAVLAAIAVVTGGIAVARFRTLVRP